MSLVESFDGRREPDPDPRDTRDLARDAAINGGVDEETLQDALQRVQQLKRQAGEDTRDEWDDAEQALLGALSAVRREQHQINQSEVDQ